MECGPAPGMLKLIASSPGWALAQSIAARNDPGPLSFVFLTTVEQAPVIVTGNVQVAWFPDASVVVQVTGVVPTENVEPEGGEQINVAAGSLTVGGG